MTFLKNHPFAVEAYFERSLVLTFAMPKEQIQHLIPPCLELDTHDNKWAFIAVAMVKTSALRPKGFPACMGNDFFLIGYRIFVKYHNHAGKRWRGLYILKSETNKKKMEFLGSIFTHYNYTTTDIEEIKNGTKTSIQSIQSGLKVIINENEIEAPLPDGSPFKDWKTARRFAGPLPFTFSFLEKNKEVLIIEGVRQNWEPKPVKVEEFKVDFIADLNLKNVVLANAFEIKNIPYYWKKGKIEKWK